ncbi:hypothetical protein CWI38_0312p0020 [Hamiltosporidium tvaerminnensis]|uniref:Uncharacterized protein n=1 Tax=Hamiltosporidium tvaerminnensis TaxID=1176355 RepID=A0A4Q9LYL7_9MICR|nr:hypothetical protein CWI38_0312p0020 [Hamiltosporidium tvaerminnensis]
MGGIKRSGMHKETNPPLKQASNDNNCAKHAKTKNYRPFFRRRTSLDEPTININDESNLEDERFKTLNDLKQDDVLACQLFNLSLEKVVRDSANSNPSTPDYIDLIARSEASLQRAKKKVMLYETLLRPILMYRSEFSVLKNIDEQRVAETPQQGILHRIEEYVSIGLNLPEQTPLGFEPYTSLKMESGKAQDLLN